MCYVFKYVPDYTFYPFVQHLDLVRRFNIEHYSSSYCNVKTNTGTWLWCHGNNSIINDKNNFSGEYSCLSVDLVFKRQFSYYLITIYVPGCMLVIVSWVRWKLTATFYTNNQIQDCCNRNFLTRWTSGSTPRRCPPGWLSASPPCSPCPHRWASSSSGPTRWLCPACPPSPPRTPSWSSI